MTNRTKRTENDNQEREQRGDREREREDRRNRGAQRRASPLTSGRHLKIQSETHTTQHGTPDPTRTRGYWDAHLRAAHATHDLLRWRKTLPRFRWLSTLSHAGLMVPTAPGAHAWFRRLVRCSQTWSPRCAPRLMSDCIAEAPPRCLHLC